MSTTDLTIAPSATEKPSVAEGRPGTGVPWARVALACAMLVVAGGARMFQEWRVQTVIQNGKNSPFPLRGPQGLPMALGSWQVPGQREEELDVGVEQILQCVDYMKRRYVDDQTGVAVEALVLYGPTAIAHQPELCYPGAGFRQLEDARQRWITIPGGKAQFLSLIFSKGEGGAAERQSVFYALRYDNRWSVDINYKRLNRLPGLYKVQVSRRLGAGERLAASDTDPCETFLKALLAELEQRISGRPETSSR
jgi:hypothetical protein